uniref:Uncharacterized protein n=1 Tax=viral metagenome TaxID=1070528 RepID=A0A6M3KF78_9ZZZZ
MTEKEFIDEYNTICKEYLKKRGKLSDLTDHELYIWIAGQTVRFGRDLKASLENAKCLMQDRQKAEKLFSLENIDLLNY